MAALGGTLAIASSSRAGTTVTGTLPARVLETVGNVNRTVARAMTIGDLRVQPFWIVVSTPIGIAVRNRWSRGDRRGRRSPPRPGWPR